MLLRRLILLMALALLPAWAGAQDFIRYFPTSGDGIYAVGIKPTNMAVVTTGTAEETVYTWTIPANTFPDIYSGFRIDAIFVHAAGVNATSYKVKINGNSIALGSTSVAAEVVRASGQCRVSAAAEMLCDGQQFKNTSVSSNSAQPATTFTNPVVVTITMTTGVSAGDLVLRNVAAIYYR